jgi:hypothetical protein
VVFTYIVGAVLKRSYPCPDSWTAVVVREPKRDTVLAYTMYYDIDTSAFTSQLMVTSPFGGNATDHWVNKKVFLFTNFVVKSSCLLA